MSRLRTTYHPIESTPLTPEGSARMVVRMPMSPQIPPSDCRFSVRVEGTVAECLVKGARYYVYGIYQDGSSTGGAREFLGTVQNGLLTLEPLIIQYGVRMREIWVDTVLSDQLAPDCLANPMGLTGINVSYGYTCTYDIRPYCLKDSNMTTDLCFETFRVKPDSRYDYRNDFTEDDLSDYCRRNGLSTLEDGANPLIPERNRDFCACHLARQATNTYPRAVEIEPGFADAWDKSAECVYPPCLNSSFRTQHCNSKDADCILDPVYRGNDLISYDLDRSGSCSKLGYLPPPPPIVVDVLPPIPDVLPPVPDVLPPPPPVVADVLPPPAPLTVANQPLSTSPDPPKKNIKWPLWIVLSIIILAIIGLMVYLLLIVGKKSRPPPLPVGLSAF